MTNPYVNLIALVLLAVPPQGTEYAYAGVSLSSDFRAVAARYPHSIPQEGYVHLEPEDVHDHISAIEVSGAGPNRRVRIIFEMVDPTGQPQYPRCSEIEAKLVSTYGVPQEIRRFSEEASPRADRVWQSGSEQLVLVCFRQGRVFWAEAVQITRR